MKRDSLRRPSCSAVFLQTMHWRCGFFLLTHRDVTYWGKWRPIRRCGESALLGQRLPGRADGDDGNSIDCSRNIPISAIETVFLTNYTFTPELNRLILEIVLSQQLALQLSRSSESLVVSDNKTSTALRLELKEVGFVLKSAGIFTSYLRVSRLEEPNMKK